jgi:hypothetical protein
MFLVVITISSFLSVHSYILTLYLQQHKGSSSHNISHHFAITVFTNKPVQHNNISKFNDISQLWGYMIQSKLAGCFKGSAGWTYMDGIG